MLRFAPTRHAVAGSVLAITLLASVVTPVAGGDELVVQPGDTLWGIAHANGTTVAALAELNDIADPSFIRIGQRIVLRPPAPPAETTAPEAASPLEPIFHVVEREQTLWGISIQYGTTVAALVDLNQIANPSLIRIGEILAIPPPATPPPMDPSPSAVAAPLRVHVVRAGETLWAISRRYGTTVQALAGANLLANPSFIRTGQSLVIPDGSTPAASAPTAATNPSMPLDMASKVAQRTQAGDMLLEAAREFGVAGPFVLAVAWHESGWQPDVVSSAGAVGLMQLMPDTADWVADSMLHEPAAIDDWRWNGRAGVRLLAFYLARYEGDTARTLAAYFQGMTSVDQIGILQSTQPYIDSVLALEQLFGD